MCGLTGIAWRGERDPADLRVRVERMTRCLRHRGPDSEGRIEGSFVQAGFRRLSILDLESGDQPVSSEDGSIQVFLNGEIYNHAELRDQLERRGHRFRSRSDAEILPHLYEEHGRDFLEHLNGMFAICLVDHERRRLLLCRDRLGIKPLLYAQVGTALVFASELKALLASGLVARRLDERQILAFLDRFTCAAPHTLVEGVRKLLPGELLETGPALEPRLTRYYRLTVPDRTRAPQEGEIDALLEDSVRLQLVADVPVGLSLSGGLDSSLLALYAARAERSDVRAFTIHFPDTPREELESAEAVARAVGIEHVVLSARTDDFLAHAPRMGWLNDEPVADPAYYSAMKVAEAAAREVKVLLSGAGADELFAGYGHYRLTRKKRLFRFLPRFLQDSGLLRRTLGRSPEELAALRAHPVSRLAWHALAFAQLEPEDRRALLARWPESHDPLAALRASFARTGPAHPLDGQLVADLETYLPDQLLPVLDRSTMGASIEGRVPYLDHRLVEAALRIDGRYKLGRSGEPKALLRELARGRLPSRVLTRPKLGFPNAILQWLDAGLERMLPGILAREGSFAAEFLPPDWLAGLLRSPARMRARWRLIYSILVLQVWVEVVLRRESIEPPEGSLSDLFEVPRSGRLSPGSG